MSIAFDPVIVRPDPALLAAVGERLAQVLASNRRLAHSPTINFHARRRIEAVIIGLIDALDHLDGDDDREQTAIETQGASFPLDPLGDDGEPDDNGLADLDGHAEQVSSGADCYERRAMEAAGPDIPGRPRPLVSHGGTAGHGWALGAALQGSDLPRERAGLGRVFRLARCAAHSKCGGGHLVVRMRRSGRQHRYNVLRWAQRWAQGLIG